MARSVENERLNFAATHRHQRVLDGWEGFLSTSKYAKLANCSPDTALRDIRELLDRGVLVQNPDRGRNTIYRLASPENVVE